MSLVVQKTDGSEVVTGFIGADFSSILPVEGVRIGEHEMSLEHFGAMAIHFLGGGFLGWRNNETPEPINNALSQLFEIYEQVDGKWVRKAKHQVFV